ncbi:MAG: hypothetical protein M3M93_00645 [Actinomycetota bacterium]|nr:hypothetical protein [Actinomycetota bacterium]
MSSIQRFTRDGVSRYVWAGMALAAIIGLVYALIMGAEVLDEQRAVSEARAVRYVDRVLAPRLDSIDLTQPITGESADSLEAYVGLLILTDDRVERVRIWLSTDNGMLLFSTDRNDPIDIGSKASLNDSFVFAAARQGPISPSGISDTGGSEDPERSLFRTYVPLRDDAVAEIDQTDEGTIAPVRSEWLTYQILAGVLVLLFLTMSALSLRDPIQPINVGVAPTASIPAGFSLIDNDRLHAVREVYRLSAERVKRLQEKLSESEEARRRLEGDIQRALVLAESSVTRPAAPAPPAVPASDAEPAVLQVPESEVVDEVNDDRVAAATAGPTGASLKQKPLPPTPKETPAGKEPRRASKRQKARPESPAAARGHTADPEIRDAKAHAAALENFLRLAETERQPNDDGDQGAVRALSPAAARKKLLAERLKPPPQEESVGDPRTGTD